MSEIEGMIIEKDERIVDLLAEIRGANELEVLMKREREEMERDMLTQMSKKSHTGSASGSNREGMSGSGSGGGSGGNDKDIPYDENVTSPVGLGPPLAMARLSSPPLTPATPYTATSA